MNGQRTFFNYFFVEYFIKTSRELGGWALPISYHRGQGFGHNILIQIPYLVFIWIAFGEDQTEVA